MQDAVSGAAGLLEQPGIQAVVQWLIPLGIVIAGLFLGWLFEWGVVRMIHRVAQKTAARWDDIIARSCRRTFAGLFFAAGLWLAAIYAPLSDRTEGFLIKIIGAIAALFATVFIARLAAEFLAFFLDRLGKAIASASLISNTVKFVIIAVGIIFVLNSFIEITPLIGALGIGGLAAALALQDTLSNLFAGFQIIATRQVRPGDYISLEHGELGMVTDVNWRNVTIRSHPDENLIIVPNSKLATTVMINYSLPRRMLMESLTVGVAYDSDLDKVEQIAQEVATEVVTELSGAEPSVKPQIRFREFGDSSINFQVRLYLPQLKGRAVFKHEFIKRLHKRFNAEGIEIPFPIRNVYIRRNETGSE